MIVVEIVTLLMTHMLEFVFLIKEKYEPKSM